MALHDRNSIRHKMDDDIYASADLSVNVPKYRFPASEHNARNVYAIVRDELMLDGNSRQNLAAFCQTWAEPEVHMLMNDCIDKNMVDKDEYPQTAMIEARCVHMLANLWNAPEAGNSIGCSTTGSSEAAMLGGMAMKRRWEARQKAAGCPIDRPNLITGPVQVYSLPENCCDTVIQRVLVRHGVSRDLGVQLIEDIKHALEYLQKHPVQVSVAGDEGTGFHH